MSNSPTTPKLLRDPEVDARPRRRTFTGEYKARVIAECDSATEAGAIGAILRREGLYSSHLTEWRSRRDRGGAAALAPAKTGRPARPVAVVENDKKLARALRENAALREKLRRADLIIDAQKKTLGGTGTHWLTVQTERKGRMSAALALAPAVGMATACDAFLVPRSTVYRQRHPRVVRERKRSARALSAAERTELLAVLCSNRFVDANPAEVYATLLDEGVYLASVSTMYRVLRAQRTSLPRFRLRDRVYWRSEFAPGDELGIVVENVFVHKVLVAPDRSPHSREWIPREKLTLVQG